MIRIIKDQIDETTDDSDWGSEPISKRPKFALTED